LEKTGRIKVDSSVIVFTETTMSAALGYISVGKKSCIRGSLEVQRENGSIEIGSKCYIGDHTRVWAAVTVLKFGIMCLLRTMSIFLIMILTQRITWKDVTTRRTLYLREKEKNIQRYIVLQ